MKQIKTFDKSFRLALLFFLIVVVAICFFPVLFTKPGLTDFTNTGEIGDTIGGIMGPFVAICVGVLTFFAFWVQFKANEQQKIYLKAQSKEFKFERFEARLFEMIKWHRDNVTEIKIEKRIYKGQNLELDTRFYTNREAFYFIYLEFKYLAQELEIFFDKKIDEIYERLYLDSLVENELINQRNINLLQYAKIDIIYSIVCFGLNDTDNESLFKCFENRYKPNFYNYIIFVASRKPARSSSYYNTWWSLSKKINEEKFNTMNIWYEYLNRPPSFELITNSPSSEFKNIFEQPFEKYYVGHQFWLAHYFKNLFQTILFIHNFKYTVSKSKIDYSLLVKAQLSTYEQCLLFINSLSILGREWEFELSNKPFLYNKNKLISTYKLLSNISQDILLDNLTITEFYPDIFTKESN